MCIYTVKSVIKYYTRQNSPVYTCFFEASKAFDRISDITFNPIKSQCMVFKPNRFKLYCSAVYLNGNIIDYVEKTKYLGYMFTNDKHDDVEMLRQLRLLYMRLNKIIGMFHFCTIDVELELFLGVFVRRITAANTQNQL